MLTIVVDAVLTAVGYFLAFALHFEFRVPAEIGGRFLETLPYLLVLRLTLAHGVHVNRGFWRHVGIRDLLRLGAATVLGSLLFPALLLVVGQLHTIAVSVFVLEGILAVGLGGVARIAARLYHESRHRPYAQRGTRTFVIGAGEAGEQLVRQILHDGNQQFHVVGLIDDDPDKRGRSLHNVPVLGTPDELRGLVARYNVELALIAIPSATAEQLRRLVDRCVEAGIRTKLLPPFKDLVTGDIQVSQVRYVQIEDLLGREPVELDLESIEPDLAGKSVLVTGAGGSIGSELTRQIARFHPVRLVLVDRAESPLYFVHREISEAHPEIDVVLVLASVTHEERMAEVFEVYSPDCAFHAAAYKHVPILEANVTEGVWNNVIGTLRTARSAARAGTKKFVLISTDKAVNPTSVLGVTKRLAERVVLELPSLCASSTDFRVVRFGNVLGSEGSVLPLFRRQLQDGGPLTVTHPEVRRYFMTIPEAAQLVLQAASLPESKGRIALLEMGEQVLIVDLAEQLVRLAGLVPHEDVKIVFTGLRPGEKIHEELVSQDETAVPTSVAKIRIVERNNGRTEDLARQLRYLIKVTAKRDADAIVRALTRLAPEYQPPRSVPALHNGTRPRPLRSVIGHRNGSLRLELPGVSALHSASHSRH